LPISAKINIFAENFTNMPQTLKNIENSGEIVLYQPDNDIHLEVRLDKETVWLTQQQMSELFQKDRTVITRHINNVFKEGELDEKSNVQNLHFPFSDKPTKVYNLDVIISVGYRVKSQRGIQFRRWATSVLKEYLLRGYSVNQQLLAMQRQIDSRFDQQDRRLNSIESTLAEHQQKIDFFHCGHSIKDMGKKLTAIMLMGTPPETILNALI
jgi:hypothetical protein